MRIKGGYNQKRISKGYVKKTLVAKPRSLYFTESPGQLFNEYLSHRK